MPAPARPMMLTFGKKLAATLAIGTVFAAASLVVLELAIERRARSERPWQVPPGAPAPTNYIRSSIPGLIYRNSPSPPVPGGRDATRWSNNWGYHDADDFAVGQPLRGELEIAVVGDSLTAGDRILPPDKLSGTYPALLEQRLVAQGRRVAVSNFALNGYNVPQIHAVLKHVVLEYTRPRIVIYAMYENDWNVDVWNDCTPFSVDLPLEVKALHPLRPSPEPGLADRLRGAALTDSALASEVTHRLFDFRYRVLLPWLSAPHSSAVTAIRDTLAANTLFFRGCRIMLVDERAVVSILDRTITDVEQQGARMVILVLPNGGAMLGGWSPVPDATRLALEWLSPRHPSMLVHDLTPAYERYRTEGKPLTDLCAATDDCMHPGLTGQALIADDVLAWLLEQCPDLGLGSPPQACPAPEPAR